eukprot:scaffold53_cov381-Pavlova_lutheri.AAC.22
MPRWAPITQVRARFFLVNESSSGLFESFACSILTCSRGDGFTTLLFNVGLMDPDRGARLLWARGSKAGREHNTIDGLRYKSSQSKLWRRGYEGFESSSMTSKAWDHNRLMVLPG